MKVLAPAAALPTLLTVTTYDGLPLSAAVAGPVIAVVRSGKAPDTVTVVAAVLLASLVSATEFAGSTTTVAVKSPAVAGAMALIVIGCDAPGASPTSGQLTTWLRNGQKSANSGQLFAERQIDHAAGAERRPSDDYAGMVGGHRADHHCLSAVFVSAHCRHHVVE